MKLPVFCVGIYTSQHPGHLAGCAGLFLALGNWVPKNRRLPAWCWKSHPRGNRIQSESHEFSLRLFFLEKKKYIYFFLLREHTVGGGMSKCACSSKTFESLNCSEPWRRELISCKQINQQQEWQPKQPFMCHWEEQQEPSNPLIPLIGMNSQERSLYPRAQAHTGRVINYYWKGCKKRKGTISVKQ